MFISPAPEDLGPDFSVGTDITWPPSVSNNSLTSVSCQLDGELLVAIVRKNSTLKCPSVLLAPIRFAIYSEESILFSNKRFAWCVGVSIRTLASPSCC